MVISLLYNIDKYHNFSSQKFWKNVLLNFFQITDCMNDDIITTLQRQSIEI